MSQHKDPIRTATYTITATCLSDLALVEYTSKAIVKDGKKLLVQVGARVVLVLYLVLPQWPPFKPAFGLPNFQAITNESSSAPRPLHLQSSLPITHNYSA